jgi:hypothetical protein
MSGPHGRRGLALLITITIALAANSATPAAGRPGEKRLSVAGLGRGEGPVRSRILTGAATRRLAFIPSDAWGGTYTTRSGSKVTIFASSQYPVDPAANQAAADFMDTLVHGSEISKVKIYFAPSEEVAILCHSVEADGCYSPANAEIVTIGQDTQWSTVEEVVTHEYGHHIAANRDNEPWPAIAYGTKRWATYEGVCQKEATGVAFPGDEADHYFQNPGESFAESFLHLNEVKLGVPETPWGYDPMFAPTPQAMDAIEKDVLKPWTTYALKRWSGRFISRGQQRVLKLNTPLDGVAAVQVKGPRGSTVHLTGTPQVRALSPSVVGGLVCGERSLTARVRAGGSGRYTVTAAIP